MLPSSGAKQFIATGTERRIAGGFEHDRLCPVIEPEPAPFAADMRRQQPRPTPERDQFAPQLLGPARAASAAGRSHSGMIRSRTKRSVRSFSSTSSSGSEKSIGGSARMIGGKR